MGIDLFESRRRPSYGIKLVQILGTGVAHFSIRLTKVEERL